MSTYSRSIDAVSVQGPSRRHQHPDTQLPHPSSTSSTSALPPYSSTQETPFPVAVPIFYPLHHGESTSRGSLQPSPITGFKSPTNAPYIAPLELPLQSEVSIMSSSSTRQGRVTHEQDAYSKFDSLGRDYESQKQARSSTYKSRSHQNTSHTFHSPSTKRTPSSLSGSRAPLPQDQVNERRIFLVHASTQHSNHRSNSLNHPIQPSPRFGDQRANIGPPRHP